MTLGFGFTCDFAGDTHTPSLALRNIYCQVRLSWKIQDSVPIFLKAPDLVGAKKQHIFFHRQTYSFVLSLQYFCFRLYLYLKALRPCIDFFG